MRNAMEVAEVIYNETQKHLTDAVSKVGKAREYEVKHPDSEKAKERVEKAQNLKTTWDSRFVKAENMRDMVNSWPEELKSSLNKLYEYGLKHDMEKRDLMLPYKDNKEELEKLFSKSTINSWLKSDDTLEKQNFKWALKQIVESIDKAESIVGKISSWNVMFTDEEGMSGTVVGDKGSAGVYGFSTGRFKVKADKESKKVQEPVAEDEDVVNNSEVSGKIEVEEKKVEDTPNETDDENVVKDQNAIDVDTLPF